MSKAKNMPDLSDIVAKVMPWRSKALLRLWQAKTDEFEALLNTKLCYYDALLMLGDNDVC